MVAIAGGISGLRPIITASLALLSCSIWNLIWISMGYLLGDNWEIVKVKMSSILIKYNLSVILLCFGFLFLFILKRFFR